MSERYLVGMLAPQRTAPGADDDDDVEVDGLNAEENGTPDTAAPPADSLIPSSLGMTFTVAAETEALVLSAAWGRYQKATVRNQQSGDPVRAWKRTPVSAESSPLPLAVGMLPRWTVTDDQPDVYV